MKNVALSVAVVGAAFGAAVPVLAQPPAFAVSFAGEMRVVGFTFDNAKDFTDTQGSTFKDSESALQQRWRLTTTVTSADKQAKVYWALEIGDLTFGVGGGASGAEYGGSTSRNGTSQGGGLGNDGANVETKNAYLWFQMPRMQGVDALLGIHNIVFLASPTGAFMDDDAMGIQLNLKFDPIDLQLWTAKADENNRQDADDNDLYAARLGINIAKDTRVTIEGLLVNAQCFARRNVTSGTTATPSTTPGTPVVSGTPSTAATGTCVDADVGDTFWFGATFGTKIATVSLDGSFVYGQRALYSATNDTNIKESGYGIQLTARVPVGPLSTWVHTWYTTGDENRIVGTQASKARTPGSGQAFSTASNTTALNANSDKLPVPIKTKSWGGAPFVAEAVFGHRTLGAPELGQPLYLDPSGTWGGGASVTYALTPALSVGGGAAYVVATEDNGIFGDRVIELDVGALYSYSANLSFQLVASYLFPDSGHDAWSIGWRARFAF